jgi:dATP/dGTP diphosphohydrolase, N-terminal
MGFHTRDFDPPVESTGRKDDSEKIRMDLLDPLALEGLSAVLTFGMKKYAAHNWRGGLSYSRLIGALLRHTFAILRGEYTDAESGLPHIDHCQCCTMFLSNMMKTRPDLDDLYKAPK